MKKITLGGTSTTDFLLYQSRISVKHQYHIYWKNAPHCDGILGVLTTVWQSDSRSAFQEPRQQCL